MVVERETPAGTSDDLRVILPQCLSVQSGRFIPAGFNVVNLNSFHRQRGRRMKRCGLQATRLPHLILVGGRVRSGTIYPNSPVMTLAFRRVSLMRS